ncbi:hypothetical protein GCM10009846_23840 [Agrococcus versicolor]|uniref:MFS transporter n=1 Tax=Agrococcus versicolor TaxID=501482 RepID=A0ABP5MQN8_9MICO
MITRHISLVALRRARRWMTAGLVVSIVGTRVVEGGSDGAVAADVLPVVWLAVFATAGQGVGFLAPVAARVLGRWNPSTVLVLSDVVEATLSVLALGALVLLPGAEVAIIAVYLLASAVFPAVTDVVEELYAQQIAQMDVGEALTFNASVYSVLGFIGLVLAMPLGAFLAGQSFVVLVGANAVLSAIGAAFRSVSSRAVLTPPVLEQDLDDFGVLGARVSARAFFGGMAAAGPASPLLGAAMQAGATVAGIFLYLWVASRMPFSPSTALGLVIVVFGVGATIGPWLAPLLRRLLSDRASLSVTYLYGCVLLAAGIVVVVVVPGAQVWPLTLILVLLMALFSRSRSVLTATMRQRHYRGARFASVMGWGFALTALGDVVGSWTGVALRLDEHPAWALGLYLAASLAGLVVTVRHRFPADAASGR